jgi:hypothetical protein
MLKRAPTGSPIQLSATRKFAPEGTMAERSSAVTRRDLLRVSMGGAGLALGGLVD